MILGEIPARAAASPPVMPAIKFGKDDLGSPSGNAAFAMSLGMFSCSLEWKMAVSAQISQRMILILRLDK